MKSKKKEKTKSLLEQQKEVDQWRLKLKTSMLEEEKNKHDAMEKAISILSQAKVPAYIYADLPNPDYPVGVPCIFQFNSLVGMCGCDESGNVIENDYIGFFSCALLKAIFDHYTLYSQGAKRSGLDKLDWSDPKTFTIKMEYLNYCIYSAHKEYQDRMKEIIYDEK